MKKPKIILASASLGRKHLLEKLRIPFSIVPSTINEDKIIDQNPYKMLQKRAKAKAEDVSKKIQSSKSKYRNALIIAADSMAVLGNKTYGKAKNKADAKEILKILMGQTHVFATATCIIQLVSSVIPAQAGIQIPGQVNGDKLKEKKRWEDLAKTKVTLRTLEANSLDAYVSRYNFTRFAAGYALAQTPWNLVTKIDGSYTNVVGLPFEIVLPIFRECKLL